MCIRDRFGHRDALADLVRRAAVALVLEAVVDPHVRVAEEEARERVLNGDEEEQTNQRLSLIHI